MKTLVAYYSYSGNTEKVAKKIASTLNADTLKIETVNAYPDDYDEVVKHGEDEVNAGFRPEIKPTGVNLADYDVVVLGSPVWWYTYAPAMNTFISECDFRGKRVYPFATNGGWIGHTFKDFTKACHGATVYKGLNLKFNEDVRVTPESAIDDWITTIK